MLALGSGGKARFSPDGRSSTFKKIVAVLTSVVTEILG